MPEDPKSKLEPEAEPQLPDPPKAEQPEEDIGEFINRHVFEKDSVFFEG